MGLKARGGDEPADYGSDAARAFGVNDEKPATPEEAFDRIRAVGGDGAVRAAELNVAAIAAYGELEKKPGDPELLRELYNIVDEMAGLPGTNLRTILMTGVVAVHTLRKQGGM